jgi:hypothetical protein
MESPRILYCHCAYARVVPEEVKREVLQKLTESGQPFDAVADLCELSAKGDSSLKELAAVPELRIAACYPRAVKWLFSAAQAPLADDTRIINMRTQPASDVVHQLLEVSPSHDTTTT